MKKSEKSSSTAGDTADPAAVANHIKIERQPGKSDEQLMTELAMSTVVRNTLCAKSYATPAFSGDPPNVEAAIAVVTGICTEVRAGNLEKLTDMLAAQAITLDAVFTEYSRRSLLNAGQYMAAAQQYANLAAKAQANCRATIEALAKLNRGGNQIVKVIHVHEGAQAVVADTINQGGAGGQSNKQPHAKAGDAPIASLPCPDETGNGVPIPSYEERPVSHARRQEPGGAHR